MSARSCPRCGDTQPRCDSVKSLTSNPVHACLLILRGGVVVQVTGAPSSPQACTHWAGEAGRLSDRLVDWSVCMIGTQARLAGWQLSGGLAALGRAMGAVTGRRPGLLSMQAEWCAGRLSLACWIPPAARPRLAAAWLQLPGLVMPQHGCSCQAADHWRVYMQNTSWPQQTSGLQQPCTWVLSPTHSLLSEPASAGLCPGGPCPAMRVGSSLPPTHSYWGIR